MLRPDRSLLVTGAFLLAVPLAAADWPQWRGPHRDGHAPDISLSRSWPETGPPVAWRVDGLGSGHSTPSIADGRLFLIVNHGMDESVVALDANDGSKLWQRRFGRVGAPDQDPSYPGARSTPTADGDRVYALSSDGDLACLDAASGEIRWSRQVRKEFGGVLGTWAYSESPLVDGPRVVVSPGGTEATVLALDKLTGEVAWKRAIPDGGAAGYASIIVDESAGVRHYVGYLSGGLVGIEPESGRLLWRYEGQTKSSPAVIPTPIAYRGHVYAGSFRGGAGVIKLDSGTDPWAVTPVHASDKLPSNVGGVLRVDGHLYGTAGNAFACFDYLTGEQAWADRSIGPVSAAYADGLLVLHGENGDLALVEATPDAYEELVRFSPPDRPEMGQAKAWTYPVLANGRLFIHEGGTVWAYEVGANDR
jgi:outer membrane protein assembly factor BamB